MEVILKQDVPDLGRTGDVVRVRDGFARNYLLPRGLAVLADKKNLKAFEHQKRVLKAQGERALARARTLAEQLSSLALKIPVRAGEGGKLFGAVTNLDIERLLKERGLEVERRRILLEEPIKSLGDYEIPIRVSADVAATLKVSVVLEEKA